MGAAMLAPLDEVQVPRDALAPRPLLWVALALSAGSFAGATAPMSSLAWGVSLAAVTGAWLGARCACSCRSIAGAPVRASLALAVLAIGAGLRAAVAAPLRVADVSAEGFEGRWTPLEPGPGRIRGRLDAPDGSALDVELPAEAAVPGERLRARPSDAPSLRATGPAPARYVPGSPPPPRVFELHHDELERTGAAPSWTRPSALVQRARTEVVARCDRLRSREARDIARALLAGDTSRLDPALSGLFTRTGLRHVLAISGMHVALLVGGCCLPLARLLLSRGPRSLALRSFAVVAGLLALLAFVEICGGGAPVRRAALAIAIAAAAPALTRGTTRNPCRADTLSLWSAALIAELALDPRAAVQLSLQLSYAATAGLIAGSRPIAEGIEEVLPQRIELRGAPVPPWRTLLRLTRASLVRALAASAAAVLATLPIAWCAFGEWSPPGILATALTAPLFAWLLLYGWLHVAAPGLVPAAGFEVPASWLLSTMEVVDGLAGTPCPLPPRPMSLLAVTVAASFLALRSRSRRARFVATAGWAVVLLPWHPAPARAEVVALDVGHGTAIAIRAPGPEHWIFDAGSRDRRGVADSALAPLLAEWDAARVSIVLSHADRDHAGGLEWLVERYPVRVWLGALPARISERLPHSTLRGDLAEGRCSVEPDRPGGVRAFLHRANPAEENEGSRVLEMWLGGSRIVLCGDASQRGLSPLIPGLASGPPARLLLWPHHGSDTPHLAALLAAVRPAEVWASGSAPPEVALELARRGIALRSTSTSGPLSIDLGARE